MKTNIVGFFDALVELVWADYAVRFYLQQYEKLYDPKYFTTGLTFEFNTYIADCWLTLESAVIRITALWDRITDFVLPLYILGQTRDDLRVKRPILDKRIRDTGLLNAEQIHFYELLGKAAYKFQIGSLHELRNRIAHNFLDRTEGIVPTGANHPTTPKSIEQLHSTILDELSLAREATLLLIALIVSKTPVNRPQERTT